MTSTSPAIGIDLGTTYSCVAVWQDGKVDIIPNEQGNKTTPSCVAFTDTERLVGDAAKAQMAMNPENTVFDAKRLIGRRFNDVNIQEDMKHWPFKVVNDCGNPKIEVEYKGEIKNFAPEEISSMVLSKMKELAEEYLGKSVTDAVITVPAHFNDSQRQATKDAGVIAGLNVLRVIVEPTAAALAYGLDKNLKEKKNVLIYDLGGGTFDVSVLTIDKGSLFEVKATAGDTHLGGEDFDNRLVNYFADEFKKKFRKDMKSNPRAMNRLRNAAEKAKRILSSSAEATIELEYLHDGIDFYTKISRVLLDELCSDLFNSTLEPVKQALADAEIDEYSVDDFILVGGSTRIRKIRSLLECYFCGKSPNISINPEEAVAYGAAIQAAILSKNASSQIENVVLKDVTPLSLGIECAGDVMSKIIKRNTGIPCKRTKNFTTSRDNQTVIKIMVFEGERASTKHNNLLGTFSMGGIPPVPRGTPSIEVTFELDLNGILNVTAVDKSTGNSQNIMVNYEQSRLSPAEIRRMLEDAERYREEDRKEKARVTSKLELEHYLYAVKHTADNTENRLTDHDRQIIVTKCAEVLEWMDKNTLAEKEEYDDMMKETERCCKPLMLKLHQQNGDTVRRRGGGGRGRFPFRRGRGGRGQPRNIDRTWDELR